jgi:hypothetical protein
MLVVPGEEMVEHEMVCHVHSDAHTPEEHFEARSEPEDEIGLGRPVPGHAFGFDEEQRSNVAAREVVSKAPAIVPGGDAASAEAPVEAPPELATVPVAAESLETELRSELEVVRRGDREVRFDG